MSNEGRSWAAMTWGDFLEILEHHGVTIKTSTSELKKPDGSLGPIQYLSRTHNDEEHFIALPSHFNAKSRVGMWSIDTYSRRLGITPNFLGWYIPL